MHPIKTTIKRHLPVLVPLVQVLRSKVGRHATGSVTKPPVESTTNQLPMSDVFNRVYATNYWGNAKFAVRPWF